MDENEQKELDKMVDADIEFHKEEIHKTPSERLKEAIARAQKAMDDIAETVEKLSKI